MKAFIAVALFFAVLPFVIVDLTSCKSFKGTIQSIEQMPEDQFAFQEARIGRLTRGLVALAVLDPKNPVSPADIIKVSNALDKVADDLTSLGDPQLIANALKLAGIKDQRVVILAGLIQDFFPEAFTWGATTTFLGPHARDMLKNIATAMRDGSGGQVTVAEKVEVENALKK